MSNLDRSRSLDTAISCFCLPYKRKRDWILNSTDINDIILHFFVRVSSKTQVLNASSDSTVRSIIARLSSGAGVTSIDHHLVYRNHMLSEDSTLAECAIERDATLHLTCRPGSSRFPSSWKVIDEMLSAIRGLLTLGDPDCKVIPSCYQIPKQF